ncbi:MAG: sulfotransferase [Chloroflexi bacterium]|nr:sulfotransferase [Chloroflexota bacterium]
MTDGPIFIAGPDRSGTTLLFALLASHPNISMVRRTNMWRYFHNRYGDLGQEDNFERCFNEMLRYNRIQTFLQPDAERIRAAFGSEKPTYGRLFSLFHQQHAESLGKFRWGDKSLHTEHYAARVFAEFPDAKILHITRDPRDRYASVRKRHGRDVPRLGGANGRWLLSMRKAVDNQKRFPDRYKIVRFEDLAGRPEASLKEICAFVGEEYTPEMLSMSGASDHVSSGGNSSFGKIEPGQISQKPIGRYREVLSNVEIAYIQLVGGSFMQQFGYPLDPIQLSGMEKLKFYGQVLPSSLVRMVGWMLVSTLKIQRGEPIPRSRLSSKNTSEIRGQYA